MSWFVYGSDPSGENHHFKHGKPEPIHETFAYNAVHDELYHCVPEAHTFAGHWHHRSRWLILAKAAGTDDVQGFYQTDEQYRHHGYSPYRFIVACPPDGIDLKIDSPIFIDPSRLPLVVVPNEVSLASLALSARIFEGFDIDTRRRLVPHRSTASTKTKASQAIFLFSGTGTSLIDSLLFADARAEHGPHSTPPSHAPAGPQWQHDIDAIRRGVETLIKVRRTSPPDEPDAGALRADLARLGQRIDALSNAFRERTDPGTLASSPMLRRSARVRAFTWPVLSLALAGTLGYATHGLLDSTGATEPAQAKPEELVREGRAGNQGLADKNTRTDGSSNMNETARVTLPEVNRNPPLTPPTTNEVKSESSNRTALGLPTNGMQE